MSGRPDVSIVIVNHNAVRQLRQCLASIAAHAGSVSVETIVVDNASSDGSVQMARTHFPEVVVIANADNVGYTQANNAGMAVARGRYVMLLNNDTEVLEGALAEMVAFGDAHPETGAIAPQLLNADLTMQGNVKSFPTAASAIFGRKSPLTRLFPRNRFSRRYLLYLEHDMSVPFEADYASTACLLVRADALAQAGHFDTDYFCYWSDADLCQRIKDAGWDIHCVPAARIIHYEGMGGTRAKRRSWRSLVDFNEGAYRYYVNNRLRHPHSPMRLVALAGLSLNAVRQLLQNRVAVLLSASTDVRLNPAEVPAADKAIKGLAAVGATLLVGVLLLQTQVASGELALRSARGETPKTTAPVTSIDDVADVRWLEAEAERSPAVAAALAPTGDAAPVRAGGEETPSAWAGPPAKPALRSVREISSAEHDYGLVTYMLDPYDPVLDAKIELLAELGVEQIRMDMRWPLIEPADDAWEFAVFDRAVGKLHDAGIGIIGCVAFTPPWASSAPPGSTDDDIANYPPASLGEYTEFLEAMATRYKGRVANWQLGIEPDLFIFWRPEPDPAAFVRQVSAGSAAIRAVDPEARIVYPGLTTAAKLTFLEATLKLGVAEAVDVFATHDYDNAPEGKIREDTAKFVSLIERYSEEPKETWCTEIGWSTYVRQAGTVDPFIDGVDESGQRDNLVKRWILLRDTPLGRIYTWELNDSGGDESVLLLNLGLMTYDLQPKASFFAARELFPVLGGATTPADAFVRVAGAPRTLEVHAFETEDGALALALWDIDDGAHSLDVVIPTDDIVSPVRLGLDGGPDIPVAATRAAGELRIDDLAVGREPVVLLFGRPTLHTAPDVFSPDGDGVDGSTTVAFSLAAEQAVSAAVLDPGGALVRTLSSETTLAAGEHALTWDGRRDSGVRAPDGVYRVRLTAGGAVSENRVTIDTAAPRVTDVESDFEFILPEDDRPYLFMPLKYRLSEAAHVRVDVFDGDGRFYLQLRSERMQPAGDGSLLWPISPELHPPGWYWYRVTATDAAGNVSSSESPKPILVDITDPEFTGVSVSPRSFSPDWDGTADLTTLRFTTSEDADVVAAVRNAKGKAFYLFVQRRRAAGAYTYAWNGRAYDPEARTMVGLSDGDYTLELIAFDERGNRGAATTAVTLRGGDFTGPEIASLGVTPERISPDLDGAGDVGRIAFSLDEPADVLLTISAEDGRSYPLAMLEDLAAGAHHLDWNGSLPAEDGGRAFLPSGTYTLVASGTDRLGNTSTERATFSLATADSDPPEVTGAGVTPSAFSPDGDGVADSARVFFDLGETADVIVFVLDAEGRRYDIFGQPGMEPGHHEYAWGGTANARASGERVALPNGAYELVVEASDRLGNVRRHHGEIEIRDAREDALAVTSVTVRSEARRYPTADGRDALMRFEYGLTQRADTKIAVRTTAGRVYYIAAFAGQAPGRHTVEWDGSVFDPALGTRKVLGDGTYVYLIDAVAGPAANVTASGRFSAEFRRPR